MKLSNLKVGDRVVVTDVLGHTFEGEIVNISDYRPPNMRYAVDIGEYADDYVFVGDSQIRELKEFDKPRYGDLNALAHKLFPFGMVDDGRYALPAKAVKVAIDSSPTVDAVEVVRCKDCTHGSKNEDGSISCNCFMVDSMPPTGFCSFGERREK